MPSDEGWAVVFPLSFRAGSLRGRLPLVDRFGCPRSLPPPYGFRKANAVFKRRRSMKQRILRSWQFSFLGALAISVLTVVTLRSPSTYAATDAAARVVKYSKEDIIPVRAKLRFSTLIVLPEDEEILDFTTGDKEFWVINGAHNLCYVHPAQAGIRSNLNLITASGRVYSFLLTEISSDPNAQPDLKLFVEPKEGSASNGTLRGYVRAADAEAYKKELEAAHNQAAEQIRAAQTSAAEEVSQFRSAYPAKLQFDYAVDAK